MNPSYLVFLLIISHLYGGKSTQLATITTEIQEYLITVQDIQGEYNSIQKVVFSPLQSVDDMDYKKFVLALNGLTDTLGKNRVTLFEKLKSMENLPESEIGFIDTLNIYVKYLGKAIIQLSYICAKLYNLPDNISYTVDEFSRDIDKWEKLGNKHRIYGYNINARLDELSVRVPGLNQF